MGIIIPLHHCSGYKPESKTLLKITNKYGVIKSNASIKNSETKLSHPHPLFLFRDLIAFRISLSSIVLKIVHFFHLG